MPTAAVSSNQSQVQERPSQLRWRSLLGRAANTRWIPSIMALLLLAALWEIGGRGALGKTVFLPPLSAVVAAWWQLVERGDLQTALLQSGRLFLAGFGLSLVMGVLTGALMARSRKFDYLLSMYVNFFLASPQVAFIPIIIILFGIGFWARVAAMFMYVFFMINVTTYAAIRNCNTTLIEMAESFGAKETQLFLKVMVPDALPMMAEGIRLGIIQAIKGMIVIEMIISISGLGYLTRYYSGAFRTDSLYAVVLTIVVLALVVSGATQYVERRLLRWTKTNST